MRKVFATAVLVTLTASTLMTGSAAIAQSGSSSDKQTVWPAPTGHRQPRLDQVPPEKGNATDEAMRREDAELDRKLKSICRGC